MEKPDAASLCPVCGDPVRIGRDVACESCAAPHHPDCWGFAGGCSRFGCGGLTARPHEDSSDGDAALVITEESRAPVPRLPLARALWRRVRGRAHVLPRTIGMGLAGSALGLGVLFLAAGAPSGTPPLAFFLLFMGSGAFFGLVAPWLAPLQHRRPYASGTVGALAFAVMVGTMTVVQPRGMLADWIFAGTLVATMLAGSSFSEGLLGPRSRIGQLLGRISLPLRVLGTWLVAVALWGGFEFARHGAFLDDMWIISQLALFAALSATPALERGKAEFRGWFPEERSTPELPSRP